MPGLRSNERYSVNVSPRACPSITSNRPPGLVRILMVPYFAFFGFAETSAAEANPKNISAAKGNNENLKLGGGRNLDFMITIVPPPTFEFDLRALFCCKGVAVQRGRQLTPYGGS